MRVLAAAFFALLATMSLARYATCHQRTFDLALYARLAWGLARGDLREPILGGHFLGEHCALVLVPLGLVGRAFGTVPVLLVAQAGAYASAAFPFARFAGRRGGPWLAVAGAAAWLLQPNLGHVIAYEMHPGNLALPALAWGIDAADRHDVRGVALAALATLACRDDLGVVASMLAVTAAVSASQATPGTEAPRAPADVARDRQRFAVIAVGAFVYAGVALLVVQPRFALGNGSLDAHFGAYGHTLPEIARRLVRHPGQLAAHLARPERALYVPKILLSVGLVLPLLAPRWLLPALPTVALNLVSQFVTTPNLDSHYLTPAVPFLVAAGIAGVARLGEYVRSPPRTLALVLLLPVAASQFVAGGTPLAHDFPWAAFVPDETTRSCRAALAAIPAGATVQAPDALLSHLAERPTLHRAPPPDRGTRYLVLDTPQRVRWAHDETLLRTTEEPGARDFLARPDRQVVVAAADRLVLARGDPRGGVNAGALVGIADADTGTPLAACLSLLGTSLDGETLVLDLVARAPCANDLAVRLGEGSRPRRVDLLFSGTLSPVHLRRGDHVVSRHALDHAESSALRAGLFRVGLLRSSGAPPEPTDPVAITTRLR